MTFIGAHPITEEKYWRKSNHGKEILILQKMNFRYAYKKYILFALLPF